MSQPGHGLIELWNQQAQATEESMDRRDLNKSPVAPGVALIQLPRPDVRRAAGHRDRPAQAARRRAGARRGNAHFPASQGRLLVRYRYADIELLLTTGQTPKEFWINPQSHRMGRDAKLWPDARIFTSVTVPWILRMLDVKTE
jgi:hypothetical protein